MFQENEKIIKNGRIIVQSLSHHNPEREDFEDHVVYIFNYAVCIGCFAFFVGIITALILANIFYFTIVNLINLPIIFSFFVFCCSSSILQYSIQIIKKKAIKNRLLKFIIRFLFPFGSIILIFKNPILGFPLAISTGYLIIYIRKIKNKILL